MSYAKEKDFDLFIDMFDTALTSSDPRVVNAFRQLMMMVTLTAPEKPSHIEKGPLRQLFNEVEHHNDRLHRVEYELDKVKKESYTYPYEKFTMAAQHAADTQATACLTEQQTVDYQIGKFYNGVSKGLK